MKVLLAALVLALSGSGAAMPTLGGCPVFPASNPWNQPVDTLPVAADSAQLIASIGLDAPVHADFGSGLYGGSIIGIPYVVVHGKQTPKSRVRFDYADESDRGPYPHPAHCSYRGRPAPKRRPARADRRTRHVHALRALRAAPHR